MKHAGQLPFSIPFRQRSHPFMHLGEWIVFSAGVSQPRCQESLHGGQQHGLLTTVQRLLASRLGHASTKNDPLTQMREGMAALAERDAERQLAGVLQDVVA